MNSLAHKAIAWTETGLVPDLAIRAGIRRLLAERLAQIHARDAETAATESSAFIADMRHAEIAPLPHAANAQHYEVPAAFFEQALGRHRKYSSCYWRPDTGSLDEAEAEALAISCARADIANGQSILDLGCGWGSLSFWIAESFPDCRITAVSNSESQREHIVAEARRRGLGNVEVLRCDMNRFEAPGRYDRIVSIEMFEHMRNYEALFARIDRWLKTDGRFFMHIFCHRHCVYAFEDQGPTDWMSRHFFSGGFMPSADLPLNFQRDLEVMDRWIWDGRHYERTANAWLQNMDARREPIMAILRTTYGEESASQWYMRWRMFFMACAELFGYDAGQEWFVAHYLFAKRAAR
jgi:cyclopropane-fatty-acyl-phospholipid synthase